MQVLTHVKETLTNFLMFVKHSGQTTVERYRKPKILPLGLFPLAHYHRPTDPLDLNHQFLKYIVFFFLCIVEYQI